MEITDTRGALYISRLVACLTDAGSRIMLRYGNVDITANELLASIYRYARALMSATADAALPFSSVTVAQTRVGCRRLATYCLPSAVEIPIDQQYRRAEVEIPPVRTVQPYSPDPDALSKVA